MSSVQTMIARRQWQNLARYLGRSEHDVRKDYLDPTYTPLHEPAKPVAVVRDKAEKVKYTPAGYRVRSKPGIPFKKTMAPVGWTDAVRARLTLLGMKDLDFCRETGMGICSLRRQMAPSGHLPEKARLKIDAWLDNLERTR